MRGGRGVERSAEEERKHCALKLVDQRFIFISTVNLHYVNALVVRYNYTSPLFVRDSRQLTQCRFGYSKRNHDISIRRGSLQAASQNSYLGNLAAPVQMQHTAERN